MTLEPVVGDENDSSLNDNFAVVDIDKNDKYKEIIIGDCGESDDYSSKYYYYNNSSIIEMGETEGVFDFGVNINGSSKFSAMCRASILQTWAFNKTYTLSTDHKIVEIPEDIYKTNRSAFVKKSISIYKNKNEKSPSLKLTEGEIIKFVGTDDKEWCLIQMSNGKTGWLPIENFDTIRGAGISASDIFIGLCYAD